LTKIPLIYSVLDFNLGGLELCLGGLSPPNPPVATGLSTWNAYLLLKQQNRKKIRTKGICYDITPIWGRAAG